MQESKDNRNSIGMLNTLPDRKSRPIFILENASLTKGMVRKKWKVLSSDDAKFLAKKGGENLENYEPEVVYQALVTILDSPLNLAGMVGGVYIKTNSGILFEVKTHARIPRTCVRFCGLIAALLNKSCVRAPDTGEDLLRVLDGPVMRHIPSNARVIGLSYSSGKSVDVEKFVSTISDDSDLVFVVGATLQGEVSKDNSTHDYISVSDFPLSTNCSVTAVLEAFMEKWKIYDESFLGL